MKKLKKHVFVHRDPQALKVAPETEKGDVFIPQKNEGLETVGKDLKKTIITILVFVAIIIAFYYLQTKTGLLKPVLRIFGL
jgi:hypothetical protein